MSKSNLLTGIAGVHAVAWQLSQMGFNVGTTSRNAPGVDLYTSRQDGSKPVSIQVKTASAKMYKKMRGSWDTHINKKCPKELFFIFVNLKENSRPDFYIVPSKTVKIWITKDHNKWMSKTRKDGAPHKVGRLNFRITNVGMAKKYLEKWDTLSI